MRRNDCTRRGLKLEDAYLAELPPQGTVAREYQPLPVGVHDLDGGAPWSRGEDDVVRPHDLAGGLRGRGHHHRHLAELEVHERGVQPARKVGHDTVHERVAGKVVQAADDRQPPRTGWQAHATRVPVEIERGAGEGGG
ncbi:hypothetical protein ZWY2020_014478 [Hordeum vulgare]|nr:hypothetical protein ZWY2020_014478 [Hordeum vulgare]